MLGSAIPNVLDIGAIIYTAISKDYFGGPFIFGGAEALRSSSRFSFKYPQQFQNICKEHTFATKKFLEK